MNKFFEFQKFVGSKNIRKKNFLDPKIFFFDFFTKMSALNQRSVIAKNYWNGHYFVDLDELILNTVKRHDVLNYIMCYNLLKLELLCCALSIQIFFILLYRKFRSLFNHVIFVIIKTCNNNAYIRLKLHASKYINIQIFVFWILLGQIKNRESLRFFALIKNT